MIDTIEDVVCFVLKEIGEEYSNDELISSTKSTLLFGKNLDSMGVILVVTEIEERIYDLFGVHISLADERAMSERTSPFRSVKTLVKYVETLVNEEKSNNDK